MAIFGSAGKESACNVGDLGWTPGLGRCLGERKGYPLQYSGLVNSKDCVVHEVAKNQTQLSYFKKKKKKKKENGAKLNTGLDVSF